ncbi:hypothetical protein SDJN02_12132, partial [Cucurbita argyrosperma subsp. argyrosperma]
MMDDLHRKIKQYVGEFKDLDALVGDYMIDYRVAVEMDLL